MRGLVIWNTYAQTLVIKRLGIVDLCLADSNITEYNLGLKFFNMEDAGKVLVRGVKDKGDIKGTSFLEDAYQLGISI